MSNTYLNHAGTSWPKPETVRSAVNAALAEPPVQALAEFERAQATVAQFLGLSAPERLLFTPGCTAALSLALTDLPWAPGDMVVTSELEHHALLRVVQKLTWERGVRHAVAPYSEVTGVDLGTLRDLLTNDERTGNEGTRANALKLVAMTAASNVTGQILPMKRIADAAHDSGALFLLDAAQIVGVTDFDVSDIGADIVVFAGHKGALGPGGIGGLWARPGVEFETPGAVCEVASPSEERPSGVRAAESSDGGRAFERCSPFLSYCDVGSVNMPGLLGLAAGMRWLEQRRTTDPVGFARPLRLARELSEQLERRSHCRVVGRQGAAEEYTSAVSFVLDTLPLAETEAFFAKRGVTIRVGQHCAPAALSALSLPNGVARASFGPFNDNVDLARLLAVVDDAKLA